MSKTACLGLGTKPVPIQRGGGIRRMAAKFNGAPSLAVSTIAFAALATADLSPRLASAETLLDAIDMAYQTNPALHAQQAQLRAIDEGLVQAKGAAGLQVSVNASGTYAGSQVSQPASPFFPASTTSFLGASGSAVVQATQPLFAGGANRAAVQAAAATIASGRQDLRQAEAQLLLKVVTAYEDVRLYRQTLDVLRDEVAELNSEEAETKARGDKGDLTRTDVVEAEERSVAAKAQMVAVQSQLVAASATYVNVVGQSPGELAPPPDLPGLPATVDEAFGIADLENPQVLSAVNAEKAANAEVRKARAGFGPTVSLQANAGITPSNTFATPQYMKEASVAVVASMPLFSSGVNASKVREARDNDYKAQFDVDTARELVVQQVATAWEQLLAARDAAALQEREVELQTVAVKGNRIEQKVGLRSVIDMLNAEQELVNAQVGLIQSRHDGYIASATVLAGLGRLEVRFLTPGVPTYDAVRAEKHVHDRYVPPWVGPELTIDNIPVPGGRQARARHAGPRAGRPAPPDGCGPRRFRREVE